MPTASPTRWPALPGLWVLGTMLLALLLAPGRLWELESPEECTWNIFLNHFSNIGLDNVSDRFSIDEPVNTVYLGFPYYLKINYTCEGEGQHMEATARSGHMMGLKPLVLVTFQSPVNFYRWKIEHLEIQMVAVPFLNKDNCRAELACGLSWYAPMPVKNGSVVMHVEVSSNGLGPIIPKKRFLMNINGFLRRKEHDVEFTLGNQLFSMTSRQFKDVPSRPLWYTLDHTPVLILGGISEEKTVLLTDTNFQDFFLVELSIDSCWVDSKNCPQTNFTATIYDAIATESTLFIRQNQLVYYFTGKYIILHKQDVSSNRWIRVLPNECIRRLCPVFFPSNGSEYILALSSGKNEGFVHFGTIRDGQVTFELIPRKHCVCKILEAFSCSIIWATYISLEYMLLLLVEILSPSSRRHFQVVRYNLVSDRLASVFIIPEFIPDARGLEFLMMFRMESYTNVPMVPKGMFYNPYNNFLFLWGNFLLQSYNMEDFIYLADFPKELTIKYLVNSFHGDLVLVTENEEIWYHKEESYRIYKLFPSEAWDTLVSLKKMQMSPFYSDRETMVTIFYESRNLYQLIYLEMGEQGRLVKRIVPLELLLKFHQPKDQYILKQKGQVKVMTFANHCPFTDMKLRNLPAPQIYTRQERYQVMPPITLDLAGFHLEKSLGIYQGVVYFLLWLHSKYHKPYADPVHDATWRWWKDNQPDEDYYFYLTSNRHGLNKVHLDPLSYSKISNLEAEHDLPERIFLDKGNRYSFAIHLTPQAELFKSPSFQVLNHLSDMSHLSQVSLTMKKYDPYCVEVQVTKTVLISQNALLFWITISDLGVCFDQGISGHNLMMTAIMLKVTGSNRHCYQNKHQGHHIHENLMLPVLLGCPPGKRLAFDITYTLKYNREKNRHYFDCVKKDPEMPCFLFRDTFYPFFLIQDMVTGDSGKFKGSYILKVVGGGPTEDTIREYSKQEIFHYNSPLDKSNSLIWISKIPRTDLPFTIMSDEKSSIEWLCMENSPCHDIIPRGFFAPDFFFKVLVSNRGVDNSTYCDYQLVFLLHIHGFPISAKRALFILRVSASIFISLVILYIIICIIKPFVLKGCSFLRRKINTFMVYESFYTNASSRDSSRVFVAGSSKVFNSKFNIQTTETSEDERKSS